MTPSRQLLDRIQRESSRRELFCTDDEAMHFGLLDKSEFAMSLRWLYQKRKVLVVSSKATPGHGAGYRYKYAYYGRE